MTTESSGNELSEIVYWLDVLNGNRNALVYISEFWSKTPKLEFSPRSQEVSDLPCRKWSSDKSTD